MTDGPPAPPPGTAVPPPMAGTNPAPTPDPASGPPAPAGNEPPPPPPAGSPAPPPAAGSRAVAPPPIAGLPIHRKTAEERKADNAKDRIAIRTLAAKPESLAVIAAVMLMIGSLADFQPFVVLFCSLFVGVFGWVYLNNGDSITAGMVLLAVGVISAAWVLKLLDFREGELIWLLPGVIVVTVETAMSYNGLRRRESEISIRVTRTLATNAVGLAIAAFCLGWMAKYGVGLSTAVSWPWFAGTVSALVVVSAAFLIVMRRWAMPADRRRFSPGRRIMPPPR